MEGFLMSAATGALKVVTVKLATMLGEEFKNMKDVRKEIEPLCDELNCMHAFLQKMSEEENPDDQDKVWMTHVREMSYDIEDNLDDFMICFGNDKSAKPKGIMKKCRKLLTKMKAHRRISKVIQEFKEQIKAVGERNERYRTHGDMSSPRNSNKTANNLDLRALVIHKEASELVGIDKPKNELISLLKEDGSSPHAQHQLNVVSIVGLGGLGKTTLANQVYESLKDKFGCHSFVTVSRNPDMMKVLRTILSDFSEQEYTATEAGDAQHIIGKISSVLQDKRYLIVVDDLWDSKSWEIIQCALIKNSSGSRIITTTRINEVAKSCCSSHQGRIYMLRPLNPKNSRRLFMKRIFGSKEECPSHLIEVSDDILNKCDGLPLAIISIAGLLASKAPIIDEWNKVQRSFGYALERQTDVNKMIQILSLSYFDLPPHLRSCLMYLSTFPEDYMIRKERLILRWIAEGFIHEGQGFTQYELGEMCFNELINRNLIQPVFSDYMGTTPIACQVHDSILDFIVSKAMNENFITLFCIPNETVKPQGKIRRLSLQDRDEIDDASIGRRENFVYSHARAVSVFPGSLDSLPSLLKFRHVRVLDFEGCKGLQAHRLAHLGRLFALRYLSLCETDIEELPEEIGELQCLQTLDVRCTEINELPSSVVQLAQLANLFCDSRVQIPDGFRNMQALQRLGCIYVSSQGLSVVQEICQLRNIQMLEVEICELTKDVASALCALATGSLHSLIIQNMLGSIDLVTEPWSSTPFSLKLLRIWGFRVPRVPSWISLLGNLQHLSLAVEQLGPAEVGLLGSLYALSSLCLGITMEVADRSSSSQEIQQVKISGAHGFPSLRTFQVGSRHCGFGLLFEVGAMPKLEELHLEFDRFRTEFLTNGEFGFGIQHLTCLSIINYKQRDLNFDREHYVLDAIKKAVRSNPNHPKLYVQS